MTVNWDDYVLYDPEVWGLHALMSRADARGVYKRLMEQRPYRIEQLRRLVEGNGVQLDFSEEGINRLDAWFVENLEAEANGYPTADWVSVIYDISIFLGEYLIKMHANLHWELFTWGKKNNAYQRHVIMGFSTEDPKYHTNFDPFGILAGYANRLIDNAEPKAGSYMTWLMVVTRKRA